MQLNTIEIQHTLFTFNNGPLQLVFIQVLLSRLIFNKHFDRKFVFLNWYAIEYKSIDNKLLCDLAELNSNNAILIDSNNIIEMFITNSPY